MYQQCMFSLKTRKTFGYYLLSGAMEYCLALSSNSENLYHEIFSTVILSLPLIQEGQLSVSGERMCTILVNRLEDWACPVNVWLGKLTALDMTPLGWLGRKTSTQTNRESVNPCHIQLAALQNILIAIPKQRKKTNYLKWYNLTSYLAAVSKK